MVIKAGNSIRHVGRIGADRWFRVFVDNFGDIMMRNVVHGNVISPLWYSPKELVVRKRKS